MGQEQLEGIMTFFESSKLIERASRTVEAELSLLDVRIKLTYVLNDGLIGA